MLIIVKYNLHVVGLQSRQVTNVLAQQQERIANFDQPTSKSWTNNIKGFTVMLQLPADVAM